MTFGADQASGLVDRDPVDGPDQLTFTDGLVHRQRVLGSFDEAFAFYAEQGMDLEMQPAPAVRALAQRPLR
jgi:hypothetical protein